MTIPPRTVNATAAASIEFVGGDRQGYIDIAVGLATSADGPARLQAFRAGIRERLRGSPVCDVGLLARSIEGLYRRIWEERAGRIK